VEARGLAFLRHGNREPTSAEVEGFKDHDRGGASLDHEPQALL
jgi:hypothetical protein